MNTDNSVHTLIATTSGNILQCQNFDHTILVITQGSDPQLNVLYGSVEVHGFCFMGKKFNLTNFHSVSVPSSAVPLTFVVRDDLMEKQFTQDKDRVISRVREFIPNTDGQNTVTKFVEANYPVSVILIKHEMDFASRFIDQQYSEDIFTPNGLWRKIGSKCFLKNPKKQNSSDDDQTGASLELASSALNFYNKKDMNLLLKTIQRDYMNNRISHVMVTGNKDSGKSSTVRYIANFLNSMEISDDISKCRVFILDCDVGQSELTPPGCLSLHEIKVPMLGSNFSRQLLSPEFSYYFGSITPAVNFNLYKKLIEQLMMTFEALIMERENRLDKFVLLVNVVGWVEDLGSNLLCEVLKIVNPTVLANIDMPGKTSFRVPSEYTQYCIKLIRKAAQFPVPNGINSATLRDFAIAGYLSRGFDLCPSIQRALSRELKISELISYKGFKSLSIYFHPELRTVADRFILNSLNCSIVGLCYVDDRYEENFEYIRIMNDESLPCHAIFKGNQNEENFTPVLRCIGYGFVRSIDKENRLFYVTTPVPQQNLPKTKIFAIGNRIQTPELLFDTTSIEPSPYALEFAGEGTEEGKQHLKKLHEPLKPIAGFRRAQIHHGANKVNNFRGTINKVIHKRTKK